MNKTHLTRRVEKIYFEIIEDMAKYFESSEEEIKNTFLDPLKVKFTPAQLHAEWWTSQIALMVKANNSKEARNHAESSDAIGVTGNTGDGNSQ
jgi:hypothetical protein